jgi:hypothetical protein
MTTEVTLSSLARTLATAGTHYTPAHLRTALHILVNTTLILGIGLGSRSQCKLAGLVGKSRKVTVEGQLCHSGMVAGLSVAFFFFQSPR